MTATRTELLRLTAADSVAAALAESDNFQAFCAAHGTETSPDSLMLYLTSLLREQHLNGARIRRRLRLLDRAFALDGLPAPSRDRHLQSFLRGLHQEAALGPVADRTPLYREDLVAMLDAIDADRTRQTRDVALLYLANATGLTAYGLRHLDWNDVRIRRDRVTVLVRPDPRRYGPAGEWTLTTASSPCATEAVRELRRQTGPQSGPVFAVVPGQVPCGGSVKPVLDLLPARQGNWSWDTAQTEPEGRLASRAARLHYPSPEQLRDRALLALAFNACLESKEAMNLRRRDVQIFRQGLLLRIPGRTRKTAVPRSGTRHDSVALWTSWAAEMNRLGLQSHDRVFPAIANGVVQRGKGVSENHLSNLVRTWSGAAGLTGEHTFASLRMGFMRTAAREGVPEHLILQQAGLEVLKSVERHVRREHLIRHSVVNLVGL